MWLKGLAAPLLLDIPALLREVEAKAESGNPVGRGDYTWAEGHDGWVDNLIPNLTTFGILQFNPVERTFVVGCSFFIRYEATYHTILEYVLRSWCGHTDVVSALPCGGGQKANLALPKRHSLIEMVCHERAGPVHRHGSVAERLKRLVDAHGPCHPTYTDLWLINFDAEGEASKDAVYAAETRCNRLHVTVSLVPSFRVVSVCVWRVGSRAGVATADVE